MTMNFSTSELLFGLSEETRKKHPYLPGSQSIDRRQCTRKVPMEVLALALGRTGTASMREALTILGYPTSHGYDNLANPKDSEMWIEAFNIKYDIPRYQKLNLPKSNVDLTKPAFWDALLGHVSGVTDMPHNCFGPELIQAYPNAKVILVERDVDAWFPSFEKVFIKWQDFVSWIDFFGPFSENIRLMQPIADGVLQGQFKSKDSHEMRRKAKDVYTAHYREIRECVKGQPERILEYKMGDGWEPLCKFLGKPVPNVPFPRTNEAAMMVEMFAAYFTYLARQILWTLFIYGAPLLVVFFAWRFLAVPTVALLQ